MNCNEINKVCYYKYFANITVWVIEMKNLLPKTNRYTTMLVSIFMILYISTLSFISVTYKLDFASGLAIFFVWVVVFILFIIATIMWLHHKHVPVNEEFEC
jgi:hypothetical protein